MTEVVTLGECLIAFVATTPGPLAEATTFERFVVGAEANVAVGLARLGHSVAFIGRVGADGFGEAIVKRLRGEGVDIADLAVDPDAATGLMFRERRVIGPAQVVYARRDSAGSRLTAADVERAMAAHVDDGTRWLHLTGITPALSADAHAATERAIESATRGRPDDQPRHQPAPPPLVGRCRCPGPARARRGRRRGPRQPGRTGGPDPPDRRPRPGRAGTGRPRARAVGGRGQAGRDGRPGGRPRRPRRGDRPARACHSPWWSTRSGRATRSVPGSSPPGSTVRTSAAALDMGNACGAAAASAIGDQTGLPDRAELAAILRAAADARSPDTIR